METTQFYPICYNCLFETIAELEIVKKHLQENIKIIDKMKNGILIDTENAGIIPGFMYFTE